MSINHIHTDHPEPKTLTTFRAMRDEVEVVVLTPEQMSEILAYVDRVAEQRDHYKMEKDRLTAPRRVK